MIRILINSTLNNDKTYQLRLSLEKEFKKNFDIMNISELDRRGGFVQNILHNGIVIYRSYKDKKKKCDTIEYFKINLKISTLYLQVLIFVL